MEVRPIDGNELLDIERLLDTDVVRQSKTAFWLIDQVLHDIQAMPTLTPPNEWVSVEERLPDELTMVLIYSGGIYDVAGWIEDEDGKICWTHNVKPQFWMPLPAPPDRRPPERQEDT